MANLYTDSKLGDVVKVSNTDGGYYEMVVVHAKSPNEVWLVDKAGRGTDTWKNRQDKCDAFKNMLAKSVRDSVTKTRLLEASEIEGSLRLPYFLQSYRVKALIEDKSFWWTNTEKDINYAKVISNACTSIAKEKILKYEIHPLIILNGDQDIKGITKMIPIPTLSKTSCSYEDIPCEPTIDYKGNEGNITTSKSYSGKQSAVGIYEITFTLKDTSKYNWSNNPKGATAAVTLTWEIKAPAVTPITTVPTPNKTLTYNGWEQTMTFDGYDETQMTVSGNKGTNSGTYTATFTLKSGYCWGDGSTTGKTVSWIINKKPIPVPTQKGTLTYNGSTQSPEWNNYNSTELSIGGTLSGTDAKNYTATFALDSNYCWYGGSTLTKSVDWSIGRLGLNPPQQSGTLIYNGEPQSPTWNADYSSSFMLFDEISETNADTYYVIFRCNSNCYFYEHNYGDDTSTTVSWVIKRCPTAVPPDIVDKEFEYDGEEHRPTWEVEEDSADILVLRGDLAAINAEEYTITAYPADNYSWGNGSTNGVVYKWKITRKPILKDPCLGDTTLYYNGKDQSPEWVNYPQDFVSGEGLSAVDVGEHTAVFTIDGNHCWSNRTYSPIRIKWEIDRKKISKPVYNDKLVFNGFEQHPDWVGVNFDTLEEVEDDEGAKILRGKFFEMSKDLTGIHAGEYTTVFTPTANYQWDEGGYESCSVSWEIDKYHFKYPFQSENRDPYKPNMSEYLQYNGKAQSPTLWFRNIYNSNITTVVLKKTFKVRKTSSAMNVGDYVVQLTPNADHCWEDGNSEPYDVPWKIIKCQLSSPFQNAKGLSIPSPRGEQYYTGDVIYPEFNNYDPNVLEISGETSGIDVRDYVVYFDIRDKDNYEWGNGWKGWIGKMPVTWRIINPPKLVERPIQRNYLIYNGEYQSPIWDGYDPKAMILVGGNPRKKDVGKYNVQFSLKSGYAWTDETTEKAVVPWYIYKKKLRVLLLAELIMKDLAVNMSRWMGNIILYG